MFYEETNRHRHVSPDVFVVKGADKHLRDNYLLWEEPSPRFVLELTSKSTRNEDLTTKRELYRDVLKVQEYFLFDPRDEYLTPSMRGWRLRGGVYRNIRPIGGRLPSLTTGLHLERDGTNLRFWNPATEEHLLVPIDAANRQIEEAEDRLAAETDARRRAERKAAVEARGRQEAVAEIALLRRQLAEARGEAPPPV